MASVLGQVEWFWTVYIVLMRVELKPGKCGWCDIRKREGVVSWCVGNERMEQQRKLERLAVWLESQMTQGTWCGSDVVLERLVAVWLNTSLKFFFLPPHYTAVMGGGDRWAPPQRLIWDYKCCYKTWFTVDLIEIDCFFYISVNNALSPS